MIPVTLGYFGRQSEGKTSRLFGLALMYLVGIAITYSTLGVVAALTGQLFGALLQNSWVLVGIALVMVALALTMCIIPGIGLEMTAKYLKKIMFLRSQRGTVIPIQFIIASIYGSPIKLLSSPSFN